MCTWDLNYLRSPYISTQARQTNVHLWAPFILTNVLLMSLSARQPVLSGSSGPHSNKPSCGCIAALYLALRNTNLPKSLRRHSANLIQSEKPLGLVGAAVKPGMFVYVNWKRINWNTALIVNKNTAAQTQRPADSPAAVFLLCPSVRVLWLDGLYFSII